MELYQIREIAERFNHAGTKAVDDVAAVAEKIGFKSVYVRKASNDPGFVNKIKRQVIWAIDLHEVFRQIPENAALLCQHPFHHNQLTRDYIL